MNKNSVNSILQAITRTIVEKFQPEQIILFGSYAWGSPGPDSDIDLLVVKEVDDTRRVAREIDREFFPRPFALDLLVRSPKELEQSINENRNLFLEDIVRNGQVLFSQSGFKLRLSHEPAELVTL